MRAAVVKLVACFGVVLASGMAASAASGPGCLVVVNATAKDPLALRASTSASSAMLDTLVPGQHGVLRLEGECQPKTVAWGSRWCPVTHYNGYNVTRGWVKARYVRDSLCP